VSVRFDQFTSGIVNADHCIMCAATVFGVVDCIADCQVPQRTKRQFIREQIKAALIFTRSNFVDVRIQQFGIQSQSVVSGNEFQFALALTVLAESGDMALVNCRACGKEISPNAARCPHCGEPTEKRKTTVLAIWIVAVIMLCLLFYARVSQKTREPNAMRLRPDRIREVENIAKAMRVQADIKAIKGQLQSYESISGLYPTTQQGLRALVSEPDTDPRPIRWYQLFRELPKDPWESDYVYRCPGKKNSNSYDLFSAGPDRKPDTTDDDWGNP